ncbi:uncharacterized protein LOC105392797 isoform X2 [Plutella xylostella]|uniref:uncharacterized protein LOC105392797 isoform X2 n=1 Tax=Plutella xylostella TaxID=51655 RepID=UPI0020323850|nr:uncharacterized protein LOC105392797 isoform X2 [Plutella xylostella]
MIRIRKCVVDGCKSDVGSKTSRWPHDPRVSDVWLDTLKPYCSGLMGLPRYRLREKVVCLKHFEPKSFTRGRRHYMAVPSLFTAEEISSGKPKYENFHSMHAKWDHDYAKKIPLNAPLETTKRHLSGSELEDIIKVLNTVNLEHSYALPPNKKKKFNTDGNDTNGSCGSNSQRELDNFNISAATDRTIPDDITTAECTVRIPEVISPSCSRRSNVTLETKTARKRLIKSVQQLTPRCKKMYQKCSTILKSRRRIVQSYQERIEKAEKLNQNKSFSELVEKLTPQAKTFLKMQVTLANKHIKRRRFTTEQKLLALSLQKQSPKGYKLLHKIFILPSRRTLRKFTHHISLAPGINENIFTQLKESVRNWDDKKKCCSIVFDEVALTPHLTFLESEDRIDGFVNFGAEVERKLCDHALVFMVRGICTSWRQPIAYYLCEGTTPTIKLKNILKEVVTAVSQTGLLPKALVCDQGSTFQSCMNSMRADTRRCQLLRNYPPNNKVEIDGHALNIIFDPPHLIKGIRNNFLNKDMMFKGNIARWSDIVEVYKNDCHVGEIRMLHKLTDEHVIPDKIRKMKVKNCTQVLSERTAAMLLFTSNYGTHADGSLVSSTMKNTAEAVLFFDRVFDSVNGSRGGSAPGKMRGPVKEINGECKHLDFWKESIRVLQDLYYVDTNVGDRKRVPSVKNWITTLESFINLWVELKDMGVSFFYTRNLNQDPLENFFGRIRALNYRNVNPDPYSFICSFKSLLVTDVLGPHSPNSNCEEDMGEAIFNKGLMFEVHGAPASLPVAGPSREPRASPSPSLLQQAREETQNVRSSAFTAGFVSRQLIKKIPCTDCRKTMLTTEITDVHDWVTQRERRLLKGRNLKYPNTKFIILFRKLVTCINQYLEYHSHQKSVVKYIKVEFLKSADVSWLGCSQHCRELLDMFVSLVCRVQIHNWCNCINKIMKGSFLGKMSSSSMTPMQEIAFKKYTTLRPGFS